MDECIMNLSDVLCQHGLLTSEQAALARELASKHNLPLVTTLVRNHFISADAIFNFCKNYFKLPAIDLSSYDATSLDGNALTSSMINHYHVLPVNKSDTSLQLALSDPTDHSALEALRFHTGLRIHPVLANEKKLDSLIQIHCRPNILYSQLKTALDRVEITSSELPHVSENIQLDEPVIQFVNQLLDDAVSKQVSDIHLESHAEYCRIRFRRDGLLDETARLPAYLALRVMTRLKIMANLDITEKRLPQDGRFTSQHHQKIDLRVNTCPGLHGEHIVLRLLRHSAQQMPLTALGMTERQLSAMQHALQQPQGLIIVTGPTGSGKTATLYSALQRLNQIEKNILTVEDPVEIEMDGLHQVNVHPRIGLDFSAVLRAFLRQDPDIIMVGEIRDAETAKIAVQAAQTGHLVLSTLHTNNAVDTIKRLLAMDIAPYQLAGALSLIVAQRLVRKLCSHCQTTTEMINKQLNCEHCHQGYQGRTGIFEVVPVTNSVSQLLLSQSDLVMIENQLHLEQHTSLLESGLLKVEAGITSYAELIRVAGTPYDQKNTI
jgi:type IV pilus assembly protein PilB